MDIVDRISGAVAATPDRVAHVHRGDTLTYGQLWERSGRAAAAIDASIGADRSPVVVYGHKESGMLVAFLAAVRSGHPYIPIDSATWPPDRALGVVEESRARLVVGAQAVPADILPGGVVGVDVSTLTSMDVASLPPAVGDQDPFYVIYTSGSTGRPKGVQISRNALSRFVDWALSLTGEPAPDAARTDAVWLNQAPFSFDLSVMDLYCALGSGSTLYSLGADHAKDARRLHADLAGSDVSVWVSTPSFADLCLADPGFSAALLPRVSLFLFCGETLSPGTVGELHRRFPRAAVYNTYGPTESTVAVTEVLVTPELLDGAPLPVGRAKPGTTILIRDTDGHDQPTGAEGEIVIAGDTVSLGYLHRPDLTERAFAPVAVDGTTTPAYRTGDLGRLDEAGRLHFLGRIDNQIKLHGYRIELEDIENNLRRLGDVRQAAVVAVPAADGTTSHLRAFVQLDVAPDASPLAYATATKRRLRAFLPDYMIPKVITAVDRIPLTGNGKVDRRALLDGNP